MAKKRKNAGLGPLIWSIIYVAVGFMLLAGSALSVACLWRLFDAGLGFGVTGLFVTFIGLCAVARKGHVDSDSKYGGDRSIVEEKAAQVLVVSLVHMHKSLKESAIVLLGVLLILIGVIVVPAVNTYFPDGLLRNDDAIQKK